MAARKDDDPAMLEILRLREDERLTWSEIARKVGHMSGPRGITASGAALRYSRHYDRLGIPMPVQGRAAMTVIPGTPYTPREAPASATAMRGVAEPDDALERAPDAPVAQRITIKAERRAGWSQAVLVTSDHHFDHVHCDRDLLRFHLEQARSRKAGVLILGDLFCAMQGRMDRRAGKPDLRPEYLVDAYADAIVDDAIDWYTPYADLIWLISYGNHESAYQKHHETDILKRLHRGLSRVPGAAPLLGTYAGWLSFDLDFGDDGPGQRLRMRYHHGWGGGGPVTLGTIGTNRQAASADYDIYAQGHIHEQWAVARMRETVDADGHAVARRVPHICAGTYKGEGGGGQGWHVEGGRPLKPLGGYWLHLYWSERQQCVLPKTEEVDL